WEGLGYYSRARNLQKAAQVIVKEYGGELPADYSALKRLPGIGEYTAGAVASISFQLPEIAVDGNVLRVFARLRNDRGNVLQPAVKKALSASSVR
ncbi:MAG: A/G-specific adenine glycosylase, partial [Ruthenibacterium sp.]